MTEGLVLPLDRAGIEAIIPHRDPFLLVDEIVELVGQEPYDVLCAYVKERGTETLLPHPAVRRRS